LKAWVGTFKLAKKVRLIVNNGVTKYRLSHSPEPSYDVSFLTEKQNKDSERRLYLEGIYIRHTDVNGNNRFYLKEEVEQQVESWTKSHIERKLSIGELNHPSSPDINPERAAHRVLSLRSDGGTGYIGKSLVLESVPCGKILAGLYRDDCALGMSTRALGQVHEANDGGGAKVTNMRLITIDAVTDPSVGEYTNCILEGKEWFIDESGVVQPANAAALEKLNREISVLPKDSVARQLVLAEAVEKFVASLV
jgi:hypothetical protein